MFIAAEALSGEGFKRRSSGERRADQSMAGREQWPRQRTGRGLDCSKTADGEVMQQIDVTCKKLFVFSVRTAGPTLTERENCHCQKISYFHFNNFNLRQISNFKTLPLSNRAL